MIKFLHNFDPNPVLFSFGVVKIYWYGIFIVLAIVLSLAVVLFLAKAYKINKDDLFDLSFYLIIFGIIGARLYDVFLEWQYYLKYPIDVLKIWNGGLAIHGGVLAGVFVIYFFVRHKKIKGLNQGHWTGDFFLLTAIIATGLSLGQAVGRWGNYFNQELFGRPTNSPWGILIAPPNRPAEFISSQFFHPTFLYESLGCLATFFVLAGCHYYFLKKKKNNLKSNSLITALYLILYSALRFSLEFIRVDFAPVFLGLRWPQIMSLMLVIVGIIIIIKIYFQKSKKMFYEEK